jgi:uncharacterized membrane protein
MTYHKIVMIDTIGFIVVVIIAISLLSFGIYKMIKFINKKHKSKQVV